MQPPLLQWSFGRRAIRYVSAVCVLMSCSDASGPSSAAEGTYRLVRIDDRAVPTWVPCGGYTIVSGRIVLGPDHEASYLLTYKEKGTNRDVHYVGEGTYAEARGSVIAMSITGSWSNGVGVYRSTIELERNGAQLTRRNVGAECDARSTEHYER